MSLTNIEIKRFLAHYPPELQEIFMEVRDLVIHAVPDVRERFNFGGIAYFRPDGPDGGGPLKTGICHIAVKDNQVQVGFWHGAFLPDPDNILVGNQKAKRLINLDDYDRVPWEPLESAIQAAAEFDPRTLV
jgi:hypothetical protein